MTLKSLNKLPHDILTDEYLYIANNYKRDFLIKKFVEKGERKEVSEFFCNVWKTRNLDQLKANYDKDALRLNYEMAQAYFLRLNRLMGNKIFILTPDLSRALYLTDIKLNAEYIKFPYKTFTIYPTFAGLNPFLDRISSIIVNTDTSGDSILIQIVCMLDITSRVESTTMGEFSFFKDTEVSLQDIKLRENDPADINKDYRKDKTMTVDEKTFFDSFRTLFMFVFNTMLYINESKDIHIEQPGINREHLSNIKNPKKKKRYLKRLSEESLYAIRYIGLKYTKRFQEKHGAFSGLTHKSFVRGHWRMQWYGKKEGGSPGEYQKPIWIEPFVKGEDLPEKQGTVIKTRGTDGKAKDQK